MYVHLSPGLAIRGGGGHGSGPAIGHGGLEVVVLDAVLDARGWLVVLVLLARAGLQHDGLVSVQSQWPL